MTIAVYNRDHENWKECFSPEACDASMRTLSDVRPGHADLTGLKKFGGSDARNVLERASARETAVRVAAGTVCRQLLRELGVEITGYVRAAGSVEDDKEYSFEEIRKGRLPELFMLDPVLQTRAMREIDECRNAGDTLGGVAEIRVKGLKSGFGSCMTYAEKLDARLCAAMMSVQAIKGVESGAGFGAARRRGSAVHDEIYFSEERGFYRQTNRAGGIEGGMSNGEELVLRAAMKPIPTLMRGLNTVNYLTRQPSRAAAERSDVTAILAAEVVLESAIASELAAVVCERLGGDRLDELKVRYGSIEA